MRTTITLDDDVFMAAKHIAETKTISMGAVISDLVKKGLQSNLGKVDKKHGFPVFKVPADAQPITLEHVKMLEDEA